ncbi:MAG: HAMP domain-containing histidine kinase [Saprospiraceae bacterium]|nr:HAMP domain-containing histidine kinase [Saprospiraceae bacterium]
MNQANFWKNKRIRQILILVTISYFLLWILMTTLYYRFLFDKYEQSTLKRLSTIASLTALQIDGDMHENLTTQYPKISASEIAIQDSNFIRLCQILRSNHIQAKLNSPIYTLVQGNDKNYFEFVLTSDSIPYFRHRYISFHPTLDYNFEKGGNISAYTDEFGMWISAFSPIRDRKGKTIAVLMVDEKLNDFIKATRMQIFENLIISLIVFSILILILFLILRSILDRENKDKIALINYGAENLKMVEQLSEANHKLNQSDTFRKEMISNISHDLRTPLASITGFLELVRDPEKQLSKAERNKYIDIALSESYRLKRMVADLFELSKLETGQIILNKEAFNIYELVSDIIQKYMLVIEKKNITLKFEIHENLGLAFGDIKYIDRVFQNLLDNAVRYVPQDGYMKIWILDDADFFKVKICNSGHLLSQEDLSRIFDRYYTTENTRNSGAGLGLAIAKKICDLHGCIITAESNEYVNSFWFTVEKFR